MGVQIPKTIAFPIYRPLQWGNRVFLPVSKYRNSESRVSKYRNSITNHFFGCPFGLPLSRRGTPVRATFFCTTIHTSAENTGTQTTHAPMRTIKTHLCHKLYIFAPPASRRGGMVLEMFQRAKKKPGTHLVSPGDSLERAGFTNGSAVRGRGWVREWKEDAGCM